ncbi:sulfurtransferase TusA family protein [Caulobacter sp. S45]|uniref:sulfurtransferase TusA family protein n=1 Tax=Caulobacter sp. S45 TaxID=1641861 RepID=UPI001575DC7D|nr:sulfurtransferase TusA family protein [Caulobacter sp. S45]
MNAELPHGGETVVDARGHRCPTPTLRLRRALAAEPDGAVILLLADDPMARIDVPHFAIGAGHVIEDLSQEDGVLRFRVRKGVSAVGAVRGGRPA